MFTVKQSFASTIADQTGSPNSRFTDQRPRSKPLHDKDIILLQLQSYKKKKIAAITYNTQIVQL